MGPHWGGVNCFLEMGTTAPSVLRSPPLSFASGSETPGSYNPDVQNLLCSFLLPAWPWWGVGGEGGRKECIWACYFIFKHLEKKQVPAAMIVPCVLSASGKRLELPTLMLSGLMPLFGTRSWWQWWWWWWNDSWVIDSSYSCTYVCLILQVLFFSWNH